MTKKRKRNKKRTKADTAQKETTCRVYAIEWEEWDDEDFGPVHDGYSLHLSKEAVQEYIEHIESRYMPDSDISLMPLSVREINDRKYFELAKEAAKKGKVAWIWSL